MHGSNLLVQVYSGISHSDSVTAVPSFYFYFRVAGMIQVDIGGHPPFPTGSKQRSGNFDNLLFLAGFNFRDHFEVPNEGFSRSRFSMIAKGIIEPQN